MVSPWNSFGFHHQTVVVIWKNIIFLLVFYCVFESRVHFLQSQCDRRCLGHWISCVKIGTFRFSDIFETNKKYRIFIAFRPIQWSARRDWTALVIVKHGITSRSSCRTTTTEIPNETWYRISSIDSSCPVLASLRTLQQHNCKTEWNYICTTIILFAFWPTKVIWIFQIFSCFVLGIIIYGVAAWRTRTHDSNVRSVPKMKANAERVDPNTKNCDKIIGSKHNQNRRPYSRLVRPLAVLHYRRQMRVTVGR